MHPGGGGGHFVEVEHTGVEDAVEIDVAVVAVDNLGFGLQGSHYLAYLFQLVGFHLRGFVEENDVTEFYLLYDEVFDVFFVDGGAGQVESVLELVAHTQCINHCDYAVESRQGVGGEVGNL